MKNIIQDVSKNGKVRPWKKRKESSLAVAGAFYLAGMEKMADNIFDCGTKLIFSYCPKGHENRLKWANFCRKRLCPMCCWRKSLLTANTVNNTIHGILEDYPTYKFLFLTLTVPNVSGEELKSEVQKLLNSWKKLIKYNDLKIIKGTFRTLEITYNKKDNTYHPHIHAILVVPPGYFTKYYIKQSKYLELWKRATGYKEVQFVNIKVCKPKNCSREQLKAMDVGVKKLAMANASAEAGKYCTDFKFLKGFDITGKNYKENHLLGEVIHTIHKAIHKRRLNSFTGLLKEYKAKLNLIDGDEAENEDLVHIGDKKDCTCSVCNSELRERIFEWNMNTLNYHSVL